MFGFAKHLTIPAKTESLLIVVASGNGLITIGRIHTDNLKNRLQPVLGIYEVQEYFAFRLLVINFSKGL